MNKDIRTAEANFDLVKKFLDYANVADAAYALLEPVFEGNVKDKKGSILEKDIDTQTFGDKFNGENSTYARAIEARFQKGKIIGKSYLLFNKTIDNDITNVKSTDKLSDRTIEFVNHYEFLEHETNQGKFFLDEFNS